MRPVASPLFQGLSAEEWAALLGIRKTVFEK